MRRLRLNGMRADVSWRGPAKRYAALYRALVAESPK
jgi:starch synthase